MSMVSMVSIFYPGVNVIQVGHLPEPLRTEVMERLERERERPPQPIREGLLWCGHEKAAAAVDGNGVEICLKCTVR